ncbi:F plasmid protein 32-like protein (CMGI-2), partial [Burkholderia cenocepacia]
MQLATKFGSNAPILRSNTPLSDEQIRQVAPSIFAADKHDSRSDRYTYI